MDEIVSLFGQHSDKVDSVIECLQVVSSDYSAEGSYGLYTDIDTAMNYLKTLTREENPVVFRSNNSKDDSKRFNYREYGSFIQKNRVG